MTYTSEMRPTQPPVGDLEICKPRVVIILPTYLPESFGGAEQQTRRLAQALARKNVCVTLLAPRLSPKTPAREMEGAVTVRRFRLKSPPNLGGRHILSFLWWCICIASWLSRHRREYDIIHIVHGRLHASPAAMIGPWLKKPVLIKPGRGGVMHFDLDVVCGKRVFGSVFARGIAQGATAWVANSQEIVGDLERWGIPRSNIHDIPNGVPIPDDLGPKAAGLAGTVRFLAMGRLDPEKAFDQMIRAFAALPQEVPARLVILGDGQCRRELEVLSARLGQNERIVFLGTVEDVAPFLREAHFYLSTSLSEGMSNALLEAMAFGVLPVVSMVSGAGDLVEDGVSGLLFPAGDETALATRLGEALSMSTERWRALGRAAYHAMQSRFSIDHVAERHVALYSDLLEKKA